MWNSTELNNTNKLTAIVYKFTHALTHIFTAAVSIYVEKKFDCTCLHNRRKIQAAMKLNALILSNFM